LALLSYWVGISKHKPEPLLDSSHFTEDNSGLKRRQIDFVQATLQQLGLWECRDNLCREDAILILRALGHCPDTWRLDSAILELRMESTATFTYGEMLHVWTYFLEHRDDELVMLKRAFQFFDLDSSGYITFEEMKASNQELEDPLSDEEIHRFISLLDKNGDGTLQYEDFFGMLQSDIQENDIGPLPENSMIFARADSTTSTAPDVRLETVCRSESFSSPPTPEIVPLPSAVPGGALEGSHRPAQPGSRFSPATPRSLPGSNRVEEDYDYVIPGGLAER